MGFKAVRRSVAVWVAVRVLIFAEVTRDRLLAWAVGKLERYAFPHELAALAAVLSLRPHKVVAFGPSIAVPQTVDPTEPDPNQPLYMIPGNQERN